MQNITTVWRTHVNNKKKKREYIIIKQRLLKINITLLSGVFINVCRVDVNM